MLKPINTIWFSPLCTTQCIGIIKAKDSESGEIKFYIGIGSGNTEEVDTQIVLARGARFSLPPDFLTSKGNP